jgi:pimeloyl-ACP methyl ester carboxylesterase
MTMTGDRLDDYPAQNNLAIEWVEAADGTRLRVLTGGNPHGERLLLVHGFPQNAACWRKVIALVRDHYFVLAPDLRGYGKSELSRSGKYDLDTLVGDLVSILEATRDRAAPGPAVLCAHDWGGPIAWELLHQRPELVSRFLSLNAPHLDAYFDAIRTDGKQRAAAWYTAWFQMPWLERFFAANGGAFFAWMLRKTSAPGTFTDEDIELYVAPLRSSKRAAAALAYYRHGSVRLRRQRGKGRDLAPIRVPTEILYPTRDAALRRVIVDIILAKYCPDAEVVDVEGAKHWLPDERPDDVAAALMGLASGRQVG